ncbi:hypothetical protein GCM10025331_64780 [Actinoplanes utahensis]|nr:hypothetical protein Aut01nite_42320 [Actinoplanes utahensis]
MSRAATPASASTASGNSSGNPNSRRSPEKSICGATIRLIGTDHSYQHHTPTPPQVTGTPPPTTNPDTRFR